MEFFPEITTVFSIGALLVAGLFWLSSFFLVYHLIRFGVGPEPKQAALVFFLGSVFLFSLVVVLYGRIDGPALAETAKEFLEVKSEEFQL